jgi:hypothetical protein
MCYVSSETTIFESSVVMFESLVSDTSMFQAAGYKVE